MAHSVPLVPATPLKQLVETKLADELGVTDFDKWVQHQIDDDRSWRWTAQKLSDITGIEVAHASLYRWCGPREEANV